MCSVNTKDEPVMGFELMTSSLPRMRSTTELKQQRSFYHISFRERKTGPKPATPSLEG